jgi:hypothetical protein
MPLNYLRDFCHKQVVTHIRESRRFESMYTLQGKTWPTRHTLPMLSPHIVQDHMYLTCSTYSNPSRSHQQSWAGLLLPRKRAPGTIHNTLVDWFTGPYLVSLPSQPMNQWGQSQAYVDGGYCAYWARKHQHAIGMFNTCSRGPPHRSLTNTGGCYKFGGAGSPHTTPQPSQPAISTFHLWAPPGLQLSKFHQLNQSVEFENLCPPRGLLATWPSTVAYIYV